MINNYFYKLYRLIESKLVADVTKVAHCLDISKRKSEVLKKKMYSANEILFPSDEVKDDNFDLQFLSSRIANVNDLIEKNIILENENSNLKAKLKSLKDSSKDMHTLYEHEKVYKDKFQYENADLTRRISNLTTKFNALEHENQNAKVLYEQEIAELKHQIDSTINTNSCSSSGTKTRRKDKVNEFFLEIRKVLHENGILTNKMKKQFQKYIPPELYVELSESECDKSNMKHVQQTPPSSPNTKANKATMCVTQSPTVTRSTCTSAFIKKIDVGINVPDDFIAVENILSEIVFDIPDALSPIMESDISEESISFADIGVQTCSDSQPEKPQKVEMKTIETMTNLCNIRKKIDYIKKQPRPSSSMESILQNLKKEPDDKLSSPANLINPQLSSLWMLLGRTIFSLIGSGQVFDNSHILTLNEEVQKIAKQIEDERFREYLNQIPAMPSTAMPSSIPNMYHSGVVETENVGRKRKCNEYSEKSQDDNIIRGHKKPNLDFNNTAEIDPIVLRSNVENCSKSDNSLNNVKSPDFLGFGDEDGSRMEDQEDNTSIVIVEPNVTRNTIISNEDTAMIPQDQLEMERRSIQEVNHTQPDNICQSNPCSSFNKIKLPKESDNASEKLLEQSIQLDDKEESGNSLSNKNVALDIESNIEICDVNKSNSSVENLIERTEKSDFNITSLVNKADLVNSSTKNISKNDNDHYNSKDQAINDEDIIIDLKDTSSSSSTDASFSDSGYMTFDPENNCVKKRKDNHHKIRTVKPEAKTSKSSTLPSQTELSLKRKNSVCDDENLSENKKQNSDLMKVIIGETTNSIKEKCVGDSLSIDRTDDYSLPKSYSNADITSPLNKCNFSNTNPNSSTKNVDTSSSLSESSDDALLMIDESFESDESVDFLPSEIDDILQEFKCPPNCIEPIGEIDFPFEEVRNNATNTYSSNDSPAEPDGYELVGHLLPKVIPLDRVDIIFSNSSKVKQNSIFYKLLSRYNNDLKNKVTINMMPPPRNPKENSMTERINYIYSNYLHNMSWCVETLKKICTELQNICKNLKLLVKTIVDIIAHLPTCSIENNRDFAPPLPIYHQKTITFIKYYNDEYLDELFISELESRMFSLKSGLSASHLVNLTYLYIGMIDCDIQHRFKLRKFIYKCLYYHYYKSMPMIYTVLSSYPYVIIPQSQDPNYNNADPLINTLITVLMNMNYYTPPNKTENPIFKKTDMKYFLTRRLRYRFGEHSIPQLVSDLIKQLSLNNLKNISYCLILISKQKGIEWSKINIIQMYLMPYLNQLIPNIQHTNDYDKRIVSCLYTISSILKTSEDAHDTIPYLNTFNKILASTDKQIIQEACIEAILRLARFSQFEVYHRISSWNPSYKISRRVMLMLNSFIYRKTKNYWDRDPR